MNRQSLFLGLGVVLLLLISCLTAFLVWEIRNDLRSRSGNTPPASGPGDKTAEPAPGRTGPYTVCTFDYDLSGSFPGRAPLDWGLNARIYIPVENSNQCEGLSRGEFLESDRDFNLVIIAHADGQGNAADAHLNYEDLATHLASNAFVVVSLNRYATQSIVNADAAFESHLQNHLDYLYNSSPVREAITNDVALIGHSAGGRSVIRHCDVFSTLDQNLRAVVLLAPTMDGADTASFDAQVEAFMGLTVIHDTDWIAYGSKGEDLPMQSNFRIYDEVGITSEADIFTMEKEMLFVNAPLISHYFQNEPFTLAYVNAFLQQHVNNHKIFERFLKYQERPPSLPPFPKVWQQHEDTSRLTIADFSLGAALTAFGPITYGNGIENQMAGSAAVIDPFSPHNSDVLYFETAPGQRSITFEFSDGLNVAAHAWFGLRVTQVYHPDDNPTGEDIDFNVRLSDASGSAVTAISEHGGELHFPIVQAVPPAAIPGEPDATPSNGQTKNAMRSYLIPLSAFEEVDLTSVQSIRIEFGGGPDNLALIMDDLAFYQF